MSTTTTITVVKAEIMELFAQRRTKKEDERKRRESLFMELDGAPTSTSSSGQAMDYKKTVAEPAKVVAYDFD